MAKKNIELNGLGEIQTVVLEKAFAKAGEGMEIGAGKYSGRMNLTIDWSMTKGENYEVAPTVNLLSLGVLAKAIVMSGIQAENFMAALRKVAMEELIEVDADVAARLTDADKRVADMVEKVKADVCAVLPKAKRSGVAKVQAIVTLQPGAASFKQMEPKAELVAA